MSKSLLFSWVVIGIAVIFIPLSWNCKGSGVQYKNTPPFTVLANVPPPDTVILTSNPRLSLSWIGNDPDGYVIAFRYRWSYRLNSSSPTLEKPWSTLLNLLNVIGAGVNKNLKFALMTDAPVPNLPEVYRYFAYLPNGLLSDSATNALRVGDSLIIAGAHVWASNPITNPFPVHTAPTSGTFIFDSQDSLNPHTFEVEAVDNLAAVGLPAKVSFETPRVTAPQTEIDEFPTDTVMVLNDPTVTFQGARITFHGIDPNSRTLDYQWVVDKDQWPQNNIPWSAFSSQTYAYVTAKDLPDPLGHKHTFYVRARNEFGVIDTLGVFIRQVFDANNTPIPGQFDTIRANIDFYTLYPPFQLPGYVPRALLINLSVGFPDATIPRPSQPMLTDYYMQMMHNIGMDGKYDVFNLTVDPAGNESFPGRGTLGQYNLIVLTGDAIDYGARPADAKNYNYVRKAQVCITDVIKQKLTDYCNVGGKMIISAWALPWRNNMGVDTAGVGSEGDGMSYICHMQDLVADPPTINLIQPARTAFLGATGQNGYPDVVFDSTKADTALWGKSLQMVYTGRPYGFGEILYRYVSDSTNFHFQFNPGDFSPVPIVCATRYLGVTYKVVYFGFPLYYIQVPGATTQPSATEVLRKAFSDLN